MREEQFKKKHGAQRKRDGDKHIRNKRYVDRFAPLWTGGRVPNIKSIDSEFI